MCLCPLLLWSLMHPRQLYSVQGRAPQLQNNVGAKMMEKYGWQDGKGLGLKEQGLNAALSVEQTGYVTSDRVHHRPPTRARSVPCHPMQSAPFYITCRCRARDIPPPARQISAARVFCFWM